MIIRTDKLKVGYGKKAVVSDINLALMAGQFVCLLGPNGSGKSTILKTLVRMLAPLGGEVYLNDCDIHGLDNREMAKTTAVVLTEPVSPGLMTVYDIVMLGRHPHTGFMGKPAAPDIEKVREALQRVNAANLTERYFSELSDGEKQKVMLARALAQEPKLIVLDEPTSHLDARHRIEVMLILRQLTQEKGVTVIASLHDVDLALKACDVAVLVKDGEILACGVPEDVLHEEIVAQLYGLENASFSARLGGVELKSRQQGAAVFVVAGGGTGAGIYRALTRQRLHITTGILPANDTDYQIACSIGIDIVATPAYEPPREVDYQATLPLVHRASCVIDSGFAVGSQNTVNLELLRSALAGGKRVVTLRSPDAARALFVASADKLLYARDYFEFISAIRKAV